MEQPRMTCKELVELVTEYIEDALPPVQRQRFETHLQGCDGCTAYLEQMRQTIRLTGSLAKPDLNDEARRKLLDAFRNWKKP